MTHPVNNSKDQTPYDNSWKTPPKNETEERDRKDIKVILQFIVNAEKKLESSTNK
jgi:hypothetical protein